MDDSQVKVEAVKALKARPGVEAFGFFDDLIEGLNSILPGYEGHETLQSSKNSNKALHAALSLEVFSLKEFLTLEGAQNPEFLELVTLLDDLPLSQHEPLQVKDGLEFEELKELHELDVNIVSVFSNLAASQFTPVEFLERDLDSLKMEAHSLKSLLEKRRVYFS